MAALIPFWQNSLVVTESVCLLKPNIFTLWPFIQQVSWLFMSLQSITFLRFTYVCVSGSQVAIWDALSQMFCLPPLSSAAGIADSNFPLHHLSVPMACITDQSWSLFLLGLGLSSEFVSTQCFRQPLLRDWSRVCRGSYLLSLAFMLQCKAVR